MTKPTNPCFCRLSAFADHMREIPVPRTGDLRLDAARLAETFWPGAPMIMVNIAALTIQMESLAVHELTAGAIRLVCDAELRSIPAEPPRLMRHPWIIESASLDTPLFGDTVCLGGYPVDDSFYMIGFRYPDGVMGAMWTPKWNTDDDIDVPLDDSPWIEDIAEHQEWTKEAARFVLVLGLLLEAWRTPLKVEEVTSRDKRRKHNVRAGRKRDWSLQRIALLQPRRRRVYEPDAAGGPGSRRISEDRVPQQTVVDGHLKRVRYGPWREQIRWQWIDPYEARRWVASRVRYRIRD